MTNPKTWQEVAEAVLRGTYDGGMTDSFRESLEIGLRATGGVRCDEAIEYLGRRRKKSR